MPNENACNIPLFPLSAHLLPGGRMALRIFEPRYIRMVKQACASGTGIGMCMLNAFGDKDVNQHIFPVGTYATIEDFTLLDDGLLGITVEGKRCFLINSVETEADGLRVGKCEWLDEWQYDEPSSTITPIDDKLKELFDHYPEVGELYSAPRFDDPLWVIYRWLELLPVNAEQKQQFLMQKDCRKVVSFLTQLIQ